MLENEQKVFVKKIEIPMTIKELNSQHQFVNYLKSKGVNTARILGLNYDGFDIIEKQEEIIGNHDIKIDELIKNIAVFHKISRKYGKSVLKKRYYNYCFSIRNVNLDKVLMGYDEKFYIYPMKSYYENRKNISVLNKIRTLYITRKYNSMYNHIISKFNKNLCVIHNDISLNNVINSFGKIYLIDFDFCISSYEVVDIADAILTQYNNIETIFLNDEQFINKIKESCNIYVNINKININYLDVVYQIGIKIISFYYYIVLNDKLEFNKSIKNVYKLIRRLEKWI